MLRSGKTRIATWARVAFATPQDHSHFFGYYYQSPLSADGSRMLAHRVTFDGREVDASDRAEAGFFDLRDGSWHGLGATRAFNWQQGAMLQWLGPDFQSRIVYNDREDDAFVARVVDVTTGDRQTVPHAVYAVHPSGRRALGVRFERHYFCRAYHYEGVCDERWDVAIHPDDGILDIDLDLGTARILVPTAEVARLDPASATAAAPHWLEHVLWNPSGTRFAFLHRYGTHASFATRVFTAAGDGSDLFCLPGHAEWSYTHAGWRDDRSFVVHASKARPLARAYSGMVGSTNPFKAMAVRGYRSLRRVLPRDVVDRQRSDSGFALVRDRDGIDGRLSTGELRLDGHPSWTRDGRYMLTDTYADEKGFRHLLLYDATRDRVHLVGRFHSPFNECGYRCDLHPRFSRDGRRIVIDTAHTGRHQMLVLDVDWRRLARSR